MSRSCIRGFPKSSAKCHQLWTPKASPETLTLSSFLSWHTSASALLNAGHSCLRENTLMQQPWNIKTPPDTEATFQDESQNFSTQLGELGGVLQFVLLLAEHPRHLQPYLAHQVWSVEYCTHSQAQSRASLAVGHGLHAVKTRQQPTQHGTQARFRCTRWLRLKSRKVWHGKTQIRSGQRGPRQLSQNPGFSLCCQKSIVTLLLTIFEDLLQLRRCFVGFQLFMPVVDDADHVCLTHPQT